MLSESVQERFWKYLSKGKVRECWIWTGSLAKRGGYGQLNDKGKLLKAHRVSFEIHNGKIPNGKWVCHKCNVPPCCNPKHLYAGDAQTNWDDTKKSGRAFKFPLYRGTEIHHAKLTEKEAQFVLDSDLPGTVLAKRFGVTKTAISYIRRGKNWKHLKKNK